MANIIVYVIDDSAWLDFEATPRIATLMQSASVFRRGFVPRPVCGPSRASLLTGLHPHNSLIKSNGGAGQNDQLWRDHHSGNALLDWMKAAGYATAWLGKGVNGVARSSITGADYYQAPISRNDPDADPYWLDDLTTKAVAWMNGKTKAFLYFAPSSPHGPLVPAAAHAGTYASEPLPQAGSFNEGDMSDKRMYGNRPALDADEIAKMTERYRLRREMMESVADSLLALRAAQPNAWILLMSDNGYHHGEHRIMKGKGTYFEESIRVPMMILGPGVAAQEINALCYANVDLTATVLAIAGLSRSNLDGRSLLPLLANPSMAWRKYVMLDYRPRFYGARGVSRKFVVLRSGETEMYVLDKDPYELRQRMDPDDTKGAALRVVAEKLIAAPPGAGWAIETGAA